MGFVRAALCGGGTFPGAFYGPTCEGGAVCRTTVTKKELPGKQRSQRVERAVKLRLYCYYCFSGPLPPPRLAGWSVATEA